MLGPLYIQKRETVHAESCEGRFEWGNEVVLDMAYS